MTAALAAVGGKWNLIALYWLAEKPRRFNELRRVMPSISHKVLTQTLRDLENNGLVCREAVGRAPASVTYRLSSHGQTIAPVVEAVRLWGHVHLVERGSAPGDAPSLQAAGSRRRSALR